MYIVLVTVVRTWKPKYWSMRIVNKWKCISICTIYIVEYYPVIRSELYSTIGESESNYVEDTNCDKCPQKTNLTDDDGSQKVVSAGWGCITWVRAGGHEGIF